MSSLLTGTLSSYGQDQAVYLNQLRSIYKHTIQRKPSHPGAFFHTEFTVFMEMKEDESTITQEVKSELYVSDTKMYSKNGEVELLQDEKDSFTIMHDKRLIYRANSVRYKDKDAQLKKMLLLQDSIFNASRVVKVTQLKDNTVRLQLTVNNPMRYKANVKEMEVDFDTKKESLSQVKVVYDHARELQSVRYSFKSLGYVQKMPPLLTGAVAGKVLLNDQLLLPKYKGYKLMDMR